MLSIFKPRPTVCTLFLFIFLNFSLSQASEIIIFQQGSTHQIFGGPSNNQAITYSDSILVMGPWGSGAPYNGQFEAPDGAIHTCQWNGWTSKDNTTVGIEFWHVSTYNAANLNGHSEGNHAAWCGSMDFPSCGEEDADGGYGNSLTEYLAWETEVADPQQPTTLTIDAWLNFNVEPDCDFIHVGYFVGENESMSEVALFSGTGENIHLTETISYLPGQYVGDAENLVRLYIQATSDTGWSDADCMYQSNGAVQIDDITVTVNNGNISYFEDFESGSLGQWTPGVIVGEGVGDFANLRYNLNDIDPCNSNQSCQVNFIDDGVVVPGTGGSTCISFCYGPGGYVVNTTGGLAGPDFHLDNCVHSPVMAWPANAPRGCLLEFDNYEHEPLGINSAGLFTTWHIRSTTSTDPADIEEAVWFTDEFVSYGEGYIREYHNFSSRLEDDTMFVQVKLGVIESGYFWGWTGNDASPAPYFDNVRVTAFDMCGPTMSAREICLANDGFPACGSLDTQNLSNNSVRFDMARNIALQGSNRVDPGDSVVINIYSTRDGASLTGPPLMHYRVKANPFFDPYRTTGLPLAGTIPGSTIYGSTFSFDLPDTGFFFPGDLMHYYFTATDNVSGQDPRTSILPADTLGFSNFDDALSYTQSFTFRALPTVRGMDGENFVTPEILLWDDLGNDACRPHWHTALDQSLGNWDSSWYGPAYDVYCTKAPSSGLDNGLGRRATAAQLQEYSVIFYASGDIYMPTLAKVMENTGETPNLDILETWLRLGQKNMFLAGDNIVSSVSNNSTQGQAFLNDWLGVELTSGNIRPYISNQVTPLVQILQGNPVLSEPETWITYGGCPGINTFDAVEVTNEGVRLAEFLAPYGSAGNYPYSAATWKEVAEFGSKVISLPYDLGYIWDNPNTDKAPPAMSARATILRQCLDYFWVWTGPPSAVPDAKSFSTHHYPNPFNPKTRIEFNMPQAGHLKIRIFNIRGELVCVLLDEVQEAGPGSVVWNGTDREGNAVSSGVYFYEAHTNGEIKVGKMAFVK